MRESKEAVGARVAEEKRVLRAAMRRMRGELPDRERRTAMIVEHLAAIPALASASRVMAYEAVPGEVDPAALVEWLRSRSIEVRMPEDGVAAWWPDVFVVPGTAFTPRGERVGQGGGWYDRFLPGRRPDSVTIGVGFAPQLVEVVPTEVHDVVLDCVVTEDGPLWRDGPRPPGTADVDHR
jgi:5-formyltetrahydrofolate cyclo-ligase